MISRYVVPEARKPRAHDAWETNNLFYQERLRSHAQAFDGLLSLIPAKYYYGEDGSVRDHPD
jgi:hypothetical protein